MMIKENNLFSQEIWDAMVSPEARKKEAPGRHYAEVIHHRLCEKLNFTSNQQMPKVKAVNCNIPKRIIAYRRMANGKFVNYTPHFYVYDSAFEYVWNRPLEAVNRIKQQVQCIIAPDFSVYHDLPRPIKHWNIFRNKFIAALWQWYDIEVIPNVSWICDDYKASFEGWPTNSLIAVNSTGVGFSHRAKRMWLDGYHAMLDSLKPTHILRYGVKIEGEDETISTYYPNDNKTVIGYGR